MHTLELEQKCKLLYNGNSNYVFKINSITHKIKCLYQMNKLAYEDDKYILVVWSKMVPRFYSHYYIRAVATGMAGTAMAIYHFLLK